ncbi:MAG: hypothetical protein RLZZ584_3999, partial [Pseudomonadota bacterium]
QRRPPRPWMWRLVVGHLLLALLVPALAAWMSWTSYQTQQERALMAVRNLAAEMSHDVATEFGRIDLALLNVKARLEDPASPAYLGADSAATARLLDEQRLLAPEIDALRLTDAAGIVRHGLGPGLAGRPAAPVDLSDRDYVISARDQPHQRLIVAGPLASRINGLHMLILARRVQARDGRFAGVLYAAVSSERLRQIFAKVDVGARGAISLRTTDLRLVARHTPELTTPPPIGSTKVSAELAARLAAAPMEGSYIAPTALDGIERANAYTVVTPYPLVVIAGLATGDFLAGWFNQAWQAGLFVCLLWAGLGLSAYGLQRAWRSEESSARALLAASQRSASLLLTASDGIHVLDRGGRLVELSASFAAMLGATREQLLGRHVTSWDTGIAPTVIEGWLQHLAVGAHLRFETRHRRSDGSELDVEVAGTAIAIDGSEFLYCSARDVSARRQAQRELAQAHADLQDLYDHAPCGYHQLDGAGRFVKINQTEADWLGASPQALIGRALRDFLDPASRPHYDEHFARFKAEGQVRDVEYTLLPLHEGGAARRVSASASALYAPDGSYLTSRSVLYDITELHAAREAERRIGQDLRAMLDNRLVGIVKLDARRRILWVNRAMTTLFGHGEAELLGRSTRMLYASPDTWREIGACHAASLARGEVARAQVQMVTRGGELRWIELSGMPLEGGRGESIWVLSDVTAQHITQDRIAFLGHHDELTGLPNRRLLDDRLAQSLAQAGRSGQPQALCYLDLDGFKAVNDLHGHAAGDALLREVAQRLTRVLRAADTASRVGGDEFVLLLSPLEDTDAWQPIVQRVLDELARPCQLTLPCARAGDRAAQPLPLQLQLQIHASVGVAVYPADAREARSLMQLADAALYQAKAAGKGCARRHGDARRCPHA